METSSAVNGKGKAPEVPADAASSAASASNPASSDVVLNVTREAGVGVNLVLHPLPILNVSEHLTRTRAQKGSDDVQVYGVLLGTQSGRNVEIHNAFEMKVDPPAGGSAGSTVDHGFLKSRQAQFKQVFPTLDFMGWYSVGTVPTAQDMHIHQQLTEYSEAPLFLQLSPTNARIAEAGASGELPLSTYETAVEIAQGETRTFFVPAGYRIETGEAERVAVDHASKSVESSTDAFASSTLIANLESSYNATRMLADRIAAIRGYVQRVHAGLPGAAEGEGASAGGSSRTLAETDGVDHESLRQVAALCAQLAPASEAEGLNSELRNEYHDVLLSNHLTSLTAGLNAFNEMVDKFDLTAHPDKREAGMPPRSFRMR